MNKILCTCCVLGAVDETKYRDLGSAFRREESRKRGSYQVISTIGMFKVDSYQAFCRGVYNLIWDWERELKETKLKHLSKLSGGVVITYKLKVGDGSVE